MKVSASDFGLAAWITPDHLKSLASQGLSLGKIANDIAAFQIIDSFIDNMDQRLHGHTVTPSSHAQFSIYSMSNKGKSTLEKTIMTCLAAADFLAIA